MLAAQDEEAARRHLAILARYSDTDAGILDHCIPYPAGENVEKTLVLVKPDNFRFPNARLGGVIELFSRAGLSIIGIKVHYMSVAEAEDFYKTRLGRHHGKAEGTERQARALCSGAGIRRSMDPLAERQLGELIGPLAGRDRWESIIQFMTGTRPSQCPLEKRAVPGSEKCVALLYQGVDAVSKIREVLGPTDPAKAPLGTIRREFGESLMVNAAHASDSVENAKREMDIIRMAENNLGPLIHAHIS